jgi:hypothetical protein
VMWPVRSFRSERNRRAEGRDQMPRAVHAGLARYVGHRPEGLIAAEERALTCPQRDR